MATSSGVDGDGDSLNVKVKVVIFTFNRFLIRSINTLPHIQIANHFSPNKLFDLTLAICNCSGDIYISIYSLQRVDYKNKYLNQRTSLLNMNNPGFASNIFKYKIPTHAHTRISVNHT